MDNTEIYKDKVLSYIIGKTKLISTEDESKIFIEPPFVALQVPYMISHKTSYPTWTPFPRWAFFKGFKEYCELFDLSKSELTDLFQSYNDALRGVIKNKYYDKGFITESMGKHTEFLDKVLNRIIGETEYDNLYNVTKPVMFSINHYIVKNSHLPIYYSRRIYPAAFVEHCQNVYGLNKEEIKIVWGEYKKFIISNG